MKIAAEVFPELMEAMATGGSMEELHDELRILEVLIANERTKLSVGLLGKRAEKDDEERKPPDLLLFSVGSRDISFQSSSPESVGRCSLTIRGSLPDIRGFFDRLDNLAWGQHHGPIVERRKMTKEEAMEAVRRFVNGDQE